MAELVREADPRWLFAVVLLQVLTYAALASGWSFAIRRAGARPPDRPALVRLAFAELFTNQVVPSIGVGGTLLVVGGLRRRSVPREAAATAVVAGFLGFYLAQLAGVLGALATFSALRVTSRFSAGVLAFDVVVALAAPAATVATVTGALRHLPARIRRVGVVQSMHDAVLLAPRKVVLAPGMLLPVAGSRLAIMVLDGATLAASLAAVGYPLRPDLVVAVFVLAQVAGSMTFLPGGLGGFEAVAVGLLATLRVPLAAAVPAVLVMRAFSFWLPMIPGLLFARAEVRGEPA